MTINTMTTDAHGPSIRIILEPEQSARLLTWARGGTRAEIEAACEPSGYSLIVTVGGPYGCWAAAQKGCDRLELGEVEFDLVVPG